MTGCGYMAKKHKQQQQQQQISEIGSVTFVSLWCPNLCKKLEKTDD